MKLSKRIALCVAAATTVIALFLTAFWLMGYNFDHRGENVAAGFAFTVLASVVSVACVLLVTVSDKPPTAH